MRGSTNKTQPVLRDMNTIESILNETLEPLLASAAFVTRESAKTGITGIRPRIRLAVSEPYEPPNLPRSLKDVKRGFVPKLDAFLFFDLSNIELRILGYYLAIAIRDFSIVDEFVDGADMHRITASRIYGKPPEDVTDEERQRGKVLGFALLYGGGCPTLMRQGVVETYMEGKKLIAAYHEARPGIKILSDKLIQSYQDKGYIQTPWGSRLHPESEHKALNVLVQGCAADLMREGFRNIYKHLTRAGFKSHLCNVVHDEYIIDSARGEIYTLVKAIPPLLQYSKIHDIIPIETSIEWSTSNWAEKRPWEGEIT